MSTVFIELLWLALQLVPMPKSIWNMVQTIQQPSMVRIWFNSKGVVCSTLDFSVLSSANTRGS